MKKDTVNTERAILFLSGANERQIKEYFYIQYDIFHTEFQLSKWVQKNHAFIKKVRKSLENKKLRIRPTLKKFINSHLLELPGNKKQDRPNLGREITTEAYYFIRSRKTVSIKELKKHIVNKFSLELNEQQRLIDKLTKFNISGYIFDGVNFNRLSKNNGIENVEIIILEETSDYLEVNKNSILISKKLLNDRHFTLAVLPLLSKIKSGKLDELNSYSNSIFSILSAIRNESPS